MATTYFWRFGEHELSATPRFLRGVEVRHDGRPVGKARPPLGVVEFTAREAGRPVAYRMRFLKIPFPHQGLLAEIERDGVHVVGTR